MKKLFAAGLILILLLAGCGKNGIAKTYEQSEQDGILVTYYAMDNGTWQADGNSYQYRLEITGRIPNSATDSTYVYLSNIEDISFEQAWKASGLSSSLDDYFSAEEAVCVEMR